MNKEVFLYFLLICFSFLGILFNSLSFNPIRFHCSNYILNTYLYLLLSWAIVLATVMSSYEGKLELRGLLAILIVVAFFVLGISVIFIDSKNNFFGKHLVYILFLIAAGFLLYPLYQKNQTLFNHVAITTLALFALLTITTFLFPGFIKDSWGQYLLIALTGIIIARIVELIIAAFKPSWYDPKFNKGLSYISILIFIGLTLYDTKQMLQNARNCVNPDYIDESIQLFLNSLNLFSNIYDISE